MMNEFEAETTVQAVLNRNSSVTDPLNLYEHQVVIRHVASSITEFLNLTSYRAGLSGIGK